MLVPCGAFVSYTFEVGQEGIAASVVVYVSCNALLPAPKVLK